MYSLHEPDFDGETVLVLSQSLSKSLKYLEEEIFRLFGIKNMLVVK